MSRRDRWIPTALPAIIRAQVRAKRAKIQQMEYSKDKWLPEVIKGLGPDAPESVVSNFGNSSWSLADIAKLETAPLYWVTEPMQRVALDASLDVPEIYPDRDAPTPTGFMAFAEPLPPLAGPHIDGLDDVTFLDKTRSRRSLGALLNAEYPVVAIKWNPETNNRLAITPYTWSSVAPPDHPSRPHPPVRPGPLMEIHTFYADRGHTQSVNDLDFSVPGADALTAFLTSTWILMMTPTVAVRKTIDPRTGGSAIPETKSSVPVVTTIDLRPLRHEVKTESHPETGRIYTTRWVVRGHWRQQAVGPGRLERRPTWIPSYIKGPEGAPLRASEKVMVWRR